MKVLWICTYSNAEKRQHLSLWRERNFEYGQWIPNLLAGFRGRDDVEIHVVSTQNWMRRSYQSWREGNLFFHCYQSGIPFFGRAWRRLDLATNWWLSHARICRIVNRVRPDLVHLFGAENTEYSGAVLKLPAHSRVLVAIQGFVHREAQYHPDDAYFKMQCHFEEQILRSFTYYAGEYDSEAVVRQRNDRIVFFPMYFPVNESLARSLTGGLPRIYDLLFLGRSTKAKGIDDFMKIVRLVSRQKADIKAAIAGHGLDAAYLARLVAENSVQNNVAVLGYLPSEAEVFSLCRQSRVLLAPTYNDCFPSTIRECMTLGTPVVAYATGGIPFANKGGRQSLVLVEQGNVGAMAESAQRVLSDAAFRRALVANGRDFAHREFSLESNVNRVMGSYHFILSKEKQFGF